jgi:hypothetical protein
MARRKILQSDKNVFWEALIITVFIFGIGILLGIFIENGRAGAISEMYLKSEINLLDIKVQTEILNMEGLNCERAIQENINFGDKIYQDAKTLDRYEAASRITDSLVEQHKRYDLLRTLFWINSIKIKEKCGNQFHTVVYLYDYDPENVEIKSKQTIFSRFLSELKKEQGSDIVLIPIAKNLNLSSLDLLTSKYQLGSASVILNEELVITEIEDLEKITQTINGIELATTDLNTIPLN